MQPSLDIPAPHMTLKAILMKLTRWIERFKLCSKRKSTLKHRTLVNERIKYFCI